MRSWIRRTSSPTRSDVAATSRTTRLPRGPARSRCSERRGYPSDLIFANRTRRSNLHGRGQLSERTSRVLAADADDIVVPKAAGQPRCKSTRHACRLGHAVASERLDVLCAFSADVQRISICASCRRRKRSLRFTSATRRRSHSIARLIQSCRSAGGSQPGSDRSFAKIARSLS